jgi:hypothetical protein
VFFPSIFLSIPPCISPCIFCHHKATTTSTPTITAATATAALPLHSLTIIAIYFAVDIITSVFSIDFLVDTSVHIAVYHLHRQHWYHQNIFTINIKMSSSSSDSTIIESNDAFPLNDITIDTAQCELTSSESLEARLFKPSLIRVHGYWEVISLIAPRVDRTKKWDSSDASLAYCTKCKIKLKWK